MKRRKKLTLFFVFLLCISQIVYAVDNRGKCPKDGGETSYKVWLDLPEGRQLGQLYFGDTFTEGLDFQSDSIDMNLYVVVNNKNFELGNLIPEFQDFGNKGQIETNNGFKYNMSPEQLKLLNGLNNDLEIVAEYRARINEKAFVYIPEKDDCTLSYSHNPYQGSTPKLVEDTSGKNVTVVWDDDNDRDGLRTKQEVYYLKLDNPNDNETGPLFKVLEIPSRGTNIENQKINKIPMTWKYYKLDGRKLDDYEKIISEDKVKITYRHIPEKIDFEVNVVWEDKNNKYNTRPEDISFTISPQEMGKDYSVKTSNNWSKSFQEYRFEEGKELSYSLEFQDIDKYEKSVKKDENNYTVTYTSKIIKAEEIKPIATKDVEVKVKWVGGDPQDSKIILYRKNLNSELKKVGEFNSNDDNLSKTFEKLPVTDEKGQEYTYYAYEPEVPEGFTVSYSDDELTVINTRIPEVKPEPDPEVKPEPDPEISPEIKPDPKPDTQVVEEIDGPIFKRHDYTPTYPVVTRVPVKDSLKYIFTIDEYYYKEVRNELTRDFKMDVAPLIKSERTMLPLRYVGEALDAEVKWNEDTRTAIFIKNGRRAEIQIDNDEIVLSDGEIIKMDSKPLNINSRILVPVTNVANVFGLTNGNTEDNIKQDIEWDKDSRTVTIYVR